MLGLSKISAKDSSKRVIIKITQEMEKVDFFIFRGFIFIL